MMGTPFRFVVRTPHETALDMQARSVRVLTETGHVGVRPRMEAMVLPVEAGLVIVFASEKRVLLGTAGGLLIHDGQEATLFTPLAVAGSDATLVQRDLDVALAAPDSEVALRARFGKLEQRILSELKRGPHDAAPRRGGGS